MATDLRNDSVMTCLSYASRWRGKLYETYAPKALGVYLDMEDPANIEKALKHPTVYRGRMGATKGKTIMMTPLDVLKKQKLGSDCRILLSDMSYLDQFYEALTDDEKDGKEYVERAVVYEIVPQDRRGTRFAYLLPRPWRDYERVLSRFNFDLAKRYLGYPKKKDIDPKDYDVVDGRIGLLLRFIEFWHKSKSVYRKKMSLEPRAAFLLEHLTELYEPKPFDDLLESLKKSFGE
jgi:hypothetical protein